MPARKRNDQLTNDILAFGEERLRISENLTMFLGQYPDRWIAVKGGQVLATDPDLSGLADKLRDLAHTCVEFIGREGLEIVV